MVKPTGYLNLDDVGAGGKGEARTRILDAASEAFAELGFAGARVDRIAARAGVNKAMLYYHVGDKRALYTAVLTRNFDRVQRAVAAAMGVRGPARLRLEAVITALTRVVQEHPDHPRIVLREIASGAVNLPPEAFARMLEVVDVVRGLLEEGTAAGEFRPLDPVLAHLTIVGALIFLNATAPLRERAAGLGPDFDMPEPTADVAGFLNDLLLGGIAVTTSTGGH
jgi:AcrR family transcriptional regulator